MTRKLDAALAIAGLGLFGFVAARIGWGAVFRTIAHSGAGVALVIALGLIRLILQTRSWSIALRLDGIGSPQPELMLVRLASQGVGYLSVLGPVASEPMKISLIQKSGASATAATLVDTGVYWFSSGIVALIGCLAAVRLFTHSAHFTRPMEIICLAIAGGLMVIARPKALLPALVARFGARAPRWLQKAGQIEAAIRDLERRHPASIGRMFFLDLSCQVLVAAEVVAIFWVLRIPMRPSSVLAIEGASRAIKMMASWMPARIGADESGLAAAFAALGMSPASGLTLALARRVRDLLGALIGLSWLACRTHWRKTAETRANVPEAAVSEAALQS